MSLQKYPLVLVVRRSIFYAVNAIDSKFTACSDIVIKETEEMLRLAIYWELFLS